MNLLILVLYNLGAVAIAATGLLLERRGRPRLGYGLMFAAFLLLLNLLVGGALLVLPFIIALYGILLGLPLLALWLLLRRLRRGRRRTPVAGPRQ